ncbi:hypothetical protein SAMN06297229_1161 [Pseudidiomarina planktonica]|uniref:Coiled coil domain-containing protein n=1 Tax=Pseudidiomarina planktonica TaxID=1323738 RepID=A0A1Y6EQN3_9GAMM|nr:hypothetical protein [Pseudidiomarina planktonica]RUO65434.1 hypothetical protein CWI77_02960 [Pseudidiomarina planktonica]SMQ65018.1 hypothetical protein SAMN06297229_1161 [Pseudidiomarina planktonica]
MSEKKAFERKVEGQLEEWEAELDKMKAKAKQSSGEAEIKSKEKARDLEHRIEEGRRKLDALKQAGADGWQNVEKEIKSSWKDFKTNF